MFVFSIVYGKVQAKSGCWLLWGLLLIKQTGINGLFFSKCPKRWFELLHLLDFFHGYVFGVECCIYMYSKKNIKNKIKYYISSSFIKQNVYKKRHAWDGFMKITFVIFNFFIFALHLLSQNCYKKILKTFNFKKHHMKVFEKKLF